jgi:hypothetical protein
MAQGRMINQNIALSAKVASLSPESMALFCLLIPHFNSHGKMLANPHGIKGSVCPLVDWLTVEKIEACLTEITEKTNVKWWQDDKGLHYLQSLNWQDHQNLRADRLGADHLPNWPGETTNQSQFQSKIDMEVQEDSWSSPGVVPLEVKSKNKRKVRTQPSSDALRLSGLLADFILNNNPSARSLQSDRRESTVSKWAIDIDRMLRLDRRSISEAEQLICWCQSDPFWQANILSGSKLREQYDRLLLQMSGKSSPTARKANQSDSPYRSYECT